MRIPEPIQVFYDHYREGRVPARVLESAIAEYVSQEAMRSQAIEHAVALIEALQETPGAPQARLWTKAGARVYFPGDLGYLLVGHDGSLQGDAVLPGRRGQSLTFHLHAMPPAQRIAYRQALARYHSGAGFRSVEYANDRVARVDALREACGLEAFDDGCDAP